MEVWERTEELAPLRKPCCSWEKRGDDAEEETIPATGAFSIILTNALITELCAYVCTHKQTKQCALIWKNIPTEPTTPTATQRNPCGPTQRRQKMRKERLILRGGNQTEQLGSSVAKVRCSRNLELRFIDLMLDLVWTIKHSVAEKLR